MKVIEGKLIVIGGLGVGKTTVLERYMKKDKFDETAVQATFGVSFLTCKVNVRDCVVKLWTWDTAGQERFRAMSRQFYRKADAALVVYDITSRATFDEMKWWIFDLKKNIDEGILVYILGNKTDLATKRVVSREEALSYARSIGATYTEGSALGNQSIDKVFDDICMYFLRKNGVTPSEDTSHVNVYEVDDDFLNVSMTSEVGTEELVNNSIICIAHARPVTMRWWKCW